MMAFIYYLEPFLPLPLLCYCSFSHFYLCLFHFLLWVYTICSLFSGTPECTANSEQYFIAYYFVFVYSISILFLSISPSIDSVFTMHQLSQTYQNFYLQFCRKIRSRSQFNIFLFCGVLILFIQLKSDYGEGLVLLVIQMGLRTATVGTSLQNTIM